MSKKDSNRQQSTYSDFDPENEAEGNESSSRESDKTVSNTTKKQSPRGKHKKIRLETPKELSHVKCNVSPTNPASVVVLNLSESDSDDEELTKPTQPKVNYSEKSVYFPNSGSSKIEKTQYDFSNILTSQKNLVSARQKFDKEAKDALNRPSTSREPTVSELLAMGEKNVGLAGGSSSDSEEIDNTQPQTGKTVQITLGKDLFDKQLIKRRKQSSILEKQLQLIQKENQLLMHKTHLLCLIAHGIYVNSVIIKSYIVFQFLYSDMPKDLKQNKIFTTLYLKKLLKWFGTRYPVRQDTPVSGTITSDDHLESLFIVPFNKQRKYSLKDLVMLLALLLRSLGFKTRFVMSLQPIPLKPKKVYQKDIPEKGSKTKLMNNPNIQQTLVTRIEDINKPGPSGLQHMQASKTKNTTEKAQSDNKQEDISKKSKDCDVKVLSSESEDESDVNTLKGGINHWLEIYLAREEKWISIDIYSQKIDCCKEIYARCTKPASYIVGWNQNNTLKEVTRRYVPMWHITSNTRVGKNWFEKSIRPFISRDRLDKAEEKQIDDCEAKLNAPIPTKLSELKYHPLYALRRHLLKFECIYPPDAAPLGYVKGEPVYSRFCVQELHSRSKWIREAMSVKVNEKPYKVVKARSKSTLPGTENMSELFGRWQVENYIPPLVIDNKIPRNQYGNIEVYNPSMLPAGTVHLQVPGIVRVAKKLSIDCVPAVVGWDHHSGSSHPIIEGVVVCQEHQDLLMDAWSAETDASSHRSGHRRRQKSFKKWYAFARAQIIKAQLKRKYNFGDIKNTGEPPQKRK